MLQKPKELTKTPRMRWNNRLILPCIRKTSAENVFINTILNSRLVAVAKMVETGVYRIYGCNYGFGRYPTGRMKQMIPAAIPPIR